MQHLAARLRFKAQTKLPKSLKKSSWRPQESPCFFIENPRDAVDALKILAVLMRDFGHLRTPVAQVCSFPDISGHGFAWMVVILRCTSPGYLEPLTLWVRTGNTCRLLRPVKTQARFRRHDFDALEMALAEIYHRLRSISSSTHSYRRRNF